MGDLNGLSVRHGWRLLRQVLGVNVTEMGCPRGRDVGLYEEEMEIPKRWKCGVKKQPLVNL